MAFLRAGGGAPMVLLHGVGLRAECWFPQIRALRRTHLVIAADLPGHGESARLSAPKPALADFVDKIGGFVKTAAKGRAFLVGHSAGALIALSLAARFPERCRGVAALNAVYRRTPAARAAVRERAAALQNANADSAPTVARWFGEYPSGRAAKMAVLCRRWLDSADCHGYAALYRVFAEEERAADGALSALRVPALFLTGEKDANSTPAMSAAMAKIAPRGRAVVVRGAGHLAQLTHPAEVNAALREFAGECGGGA
ncbi:MAG: alpha/beta fold hydrolase [Gammaproteobacteria bacterium]